MKTDRLLSHRHRARCIVAAIAAQSAPGGQAQPPSTTGVVVKGKAPVSNDVLKVTLPKPQEADLPNGLHLMVLEDHRLPRVAFQIIIPGAGGYFDPPAMIGLSTLHGADDARGHGEADVAADFAGARDDVGVGDRRQQPVRAVCDGVWQCADARTCRGCSISRPTSCSRPSFPADEWERLKVRTRAGLIQQRTQPAFLSAERFSKVIFGDHPAGRVSATPETLDAITREAMVEFHKTHFVPDHALIAFAGDISLADARKMTETKLAAWKKSGAPKPTTTEPPALGPARCTSSHVPARCRRR